MQADTTQSRNLKKKHVLVVDDEPDVVELVKLQLQSDDIEVDVAFDGLAALDEIAENRPDLVLLDVLMPEYDGYEVCRKIRSNPDTQKIPVILLTAAREDFVLDHMLEAGADDYIIKTHDASGIRLKVRRMLHLH